MFGREKKKKKHSKSKNDTVLVQEWGLIIN